MLGALVLSVHSYLCHSEESQGDHNCFKHSNSQKLSSNGSIESEVRSRALFCYIKRPYF